MLILIESAFGRLCYRDIPTYVFKKKNLILKHLLLFDKRKIACNSLRFKFIKEELFICLQKFRMRNILSNIFFVLTKKNRIFQFI